jgi:hypothetical protein
MEFNIKSVYIGIITFFLLSWRSWHLVGWASLPALNTQVKCRQYTS